MAYNINGIGKSRLRGELKTGGDAPGTGITYTFPLTEQGGFEENWEEQVLTTQLIKDFEEIIVGKKSFGNWKLSWVNFPSTQDAISNIADAINNRNSYNWFFTPKVGYGREFAVNIGKDGLKIITSDNQMSPGSFGASISFRTKKVQNINVIKTVAPLPPYPVFSGGEGVFSPLSTTYLIP